jgi:hypothetical protein
MNYSYLLARFSFLIALIFILNACDKPDTTDTNVYVVKRVNNSSGTRTSDQYEYNDKWQVVEHRHTYQYNRRTTGLEVVKYFYNSDDRVEQTEKTYVFLPAEKSVYTYNSQGRPVLTKIYNKHTGVLMYTDEYIYNGQTITLTRSADTGKVSVSTYTIDERGNIVKRITDYMDPVQKDYTEQWLDYDDQKSLTGPAVADVTSKNNYRKYTRKPDQEVEILLKHTYNNAGYVTESAVIDVKGGQIHHKEYVLIPKQ